MNKIVTALNFIDDELIVSAFESMETESKTANNSTQRKATNTFRLHPKRWIAVFTSLLLVVCLAPIVYFSLPNSSEEPSVNRAVSVYQLYANTGERSFAKLTVSSVNDSVYTNKEVPEYYYLILECVVEEDFYGIMESGTSISLLLSLNITSTTHYDSDEVIEWLSSYDYLLAYYGEANGAFTLNKIDTDEIYVNENISTPCKLSYRSILPIKDNKVDLKNRYYQESGYTYEVHKDYTVYITDGMSLDIVSENIRKLATMDYDT